MENKILSLEDIKAANDSDISEVYVKEWDGNVKIKSLCGLHLQKLIELGDKPEQLHKFLILNCVCDNDGKLLFTEQDWEWLQNKSMSAIRNLGDSIAVKLGTNESIEDKTKN